MAELEKIHKKSPIHGLLLKTLFLRFYRVLLLSKNSSLSQSYPHNAITIANTRVFISIGQENPIYKRWCWHLLWPLSQIWRQDPA